VFNVRYELCFNYYLDKFKASKFKAFKYLIKWVKQTKDSATKHFIYCWKYINLDVFICSYNFYLIFNIFFTITVWVTKLIKTVDMIEVTAD
jgi:hypothetical protein